MTKEKHDALLSTFRYRIHHEQCSEESTCDADRRIVRRTGCFVRQDASPSQVSAREARGSHGALNSRWTATGYGGCLQRPACKSGPFVFQPGKTPAHIRLTFVCAPTLPSAAFHHNRIVLTAWLKRHVANKALYSRPRTGKLRADAAKRRPQYKKRLDPAPHGRGIFFCPSRRARRAAGDIAH